ncbi:MAG: phage tail-collar fiber domain-containing protein [Hafnia alvei]|uniref:phage tail-collar fiber domain-containing protein n=1 Tax=Hafnia alvei TaxID=569 RepID=UPI003F8E6C9C
MSQTTITLAFEQWKAQQAIDGKAVVLDEFVLANVPNLDIDSPIDRAEQLPAAQHIVHRQAVSATGLVNENAVVYSVTMGTEVGDFSFNWVGLINKATGTLAMIVHAPLQSKIKNAEGKQGNVLTRSFLMEYNGAASETQITTPAETWQIDFTARLSGMDERQRLENVDLYGVAAFFGDGFLVTRAASQYSITQGIGYVGGLRCQLPATQNITVTTKPVKVWADVCWKGTLTSVWAEELKITVANTLANYVQDGVQHYVFAVASIDANGVITDLRPKGSLDGQQGNKDFLRIDKSLSEIAAKGVQAQAEARKHLALGDAATKNIQASQTDSTAGAVMVVSAFGLGGTAPRTPLAATYSYDSIPVNLPTGFYTHQMTGGPFCHTITLRQDGGGTTSNRHFIIPAQPSEKIAVRWDGGAAFSYQYFYTDKNKPTASDVGALPSNGNAVSATKLATARKIAGKAFDGTVDISISAADVDAWPIATRGNIGNGTLLSTANQVGVYLISISKPETVSDFPKIGNTPLYGYGFMFVTKNGASINQLYMSHRGHIANRQSWNNETGYVNGWNIGYGTINKPTASDVGALPIGGGALNGNLTVKDTLQVGSVGNAALNIGDNDSGLRSSVDGQVDLYANSKKMGYWNGNILSFTGQIIPTNYTNFDAKYQPKGNYQPAGNYAFVGASYTKVESDARYYTKTQTDAGYAAQSSVYSKIASDARYVQDIRQSGIMNLAVGTNANTQAPAGGVVIGAIVNGTWDNNEILKYTWLQKNVNGTWLTIGRV